MGRYDANHKKKKTYKTPNVNKNSFSAVRTILENPNKDRDKQLIVEQQEQIKLGNLNKNGRPVRQTKAEIEAEAKIKRDNKSKQNKADKYEAYQNTNKMGKGDYSGAMKSFTGKNLLSNINQQMSGKESNSLLNAGQQGSEALARKANDIRGAASQNSIMNGQLGQGQAQTGKMQAEMATMQGLGDFKTQMSGLAAQEQAGAQAQALQALGLMQGDDQIGEMKRQSVVSEGQRDKDADRDHYMNLINATRESKVGGSHGALLDQYTKEVLSPENYDIAQEGNAAQEQQTMEQASILPIAESMDAPQIKAALQNTEDGFTFQGRPISDETAAMLTGMTDLDPDYLEAEEIKVTDPLEYSKDMKIRLEKDPALRQELGIPDSVAMKGSVNKHNTFYGDWDGNTQQDIRQLYMPLIGTTAFQDGKLYTITNVKAPYSDGGSTGSAYYNATIYGQDKNGNNVTLKKLRYNA